MSFNPSKCSTIHITRKKKPILTSYTLKNDTLAIDHTASYLGITISSDLSWNNHVAKVVAKGNRSLGFIRRNIRTHSSDTKEKAYQTIVRPTLEYASSVWAPGQKTLKNAVEMVQRRVARYVCGRYARTDSVSDMLAKLNWDTLEQRRDMSRIMIMLKIIYSLIAIPTTQFIPTAVHIRGKTNKYRQLPTRTNYYKYSFFPTAITLWNAPPRYCQENRAGTVQR